MAQIREYQQRAEAFGPVRNQRANAEDFGGGQGVAALGQAAQSVGDVILKRAEADEISDLNKKVAKGHVEFTQYYNDALQKGNIDPEDFTQKFTDYMGTLQQDVRTAGGQKYLEQAQASLGQHFTEKMMAGQAELAGIRAKANYVESVGLRSSVLVSDPSSFEFALTQQVQEIDSLVGKGLPAASAEELKLRAKSDLAKSAVRGWIDINPELAKDQLSKGQWDKFLAGDEKAQMMGVADQAIRGQAAEAERLRAQQERVIKEQQSKTQNTFLEKMSKGELSVKDILNSNLEAFGSGSKEQFIQLVKSTSEKAAKTDPGTFNDLFNRIHLPDGNPRKIVDENDLNAFVGKGLNFESLNQLRSEVQGKKTEEGDIESTLKKGVIETARNALTKSSATGIKDPRGDEQLQKFMAFFFDEYAKQRKAGKSVRDLLDPNSKEYLGGSIRSFARSQQQIIKDLAEGFGTAAPATAPMGGTTATPSPTPAATPEPRQPNETAAQYLERKKKSKGN